MLTAEDAKKGNNPECHMSTRVPDGSRYRTPFCFENNFIQTNTAKNLSYHQQPIILDFKANTKSLFQGGQNMINQLARLVSNKSHLAQGNSPHYNRKSKVSSAFSYSPLRFFQITISPITIVIKLDLLL